MKHEISFRCLAGWIAMLVGAVVGWCVAEFFWGLTHPYGVNMWAPPIRGLEFYIPAVFCAISGSALGLALARFKDLPAD